MLFVSGQFLDGNTLAPIGTPLGCAPSSYGSSTIRGDGTTVDYVTFTDNADLLRADVHRFTFDVPTLQLSNCALAGRNLTGDEWARFEPRKDYRQTCAEWPSGQ